MIVNVCLITVVVNVCLKCDCKCLKCDCKCLFKVRLSMFICLKRQKIRYGQLLIMVARGLWTQSNDFVPHN